jgi:hypothetical protein
LNQKLSWLFLWARADEQIAKGVPNLSSAEFPGWNTKACDMSVSDLRCHHFDAFAMDCQVGVLRSIVFKSTLYREAVAPNPVPSCQFARRPAVLSRRVSCSGPMSALLTLHLNQPSERKATSGLDIDLVDLNPHLRIHQCLRPQPGRNA